MFIIWQYYIAIEGIGTEYRRQYNTGKHSYGEKEVETVEWNDY